MSTSVLTSEQVALVAMIEPQVGVPATYLTDAVDMSLFESIAAVVAAGTMVATSTIDAKLVQATTAGGTYKNITGKSITQLTAAGTDSNKQAIINCDAGELDIANGYRYVKLSITIGTANSGLGGFIVGVNSRYAPASNNDLSTVDEIVN